MAGRFLALLQERPRLIVSLPRNSADLAKAAADGGAEALKVHLNVLHEASGTRFGNFTDERENLASILEVGLPTGIVPGVAGALPTRTEMKELAAMGIDFFDLYAWDMPLWMLESSEMTRTVAIGHDTELDNLKVLPTLGFEMLEAAVIPHEGYGKPLSVDDLLLYQRIRSAISLPIILPTQRAVTPEDLPVLLSIGINAVMIGAIVTGTEASALRKATSRFAEAINSQ